VALNPFGRFCSLFDFAVFTCFGMKGITNKAKSSFKKNNKVKYIMQLLERVKITSLHWLKAKNVCFSFGYQLWWQQPLVCLSIG